MKSCHYIFSTYFFTNSFVPNSTTISHSPCIIYSVSYFFSKANFECEWFVPQCKRLIIGFTMNVTRDTVGFY